jgi:hypothetical protein
MTKPESHRWEFKSRFRRHAFGWRSQPAIARIKEAVAEIKKVAKKDPLLAAEGAVTFLERLSPALEQVDSSSGSIGAAVSKAIFEMVPLIEHAQAGKPMRDAWLERLFEAHQADEIPYIEQLAYYWGNLCASEETASAWADLLIGPTRAHLHSDIGARSHFHGTSACLSALFGAKRFDEIIELLSVDAIWPYKQWAVRAMAAQGRKAEALRYAEACRSRWTSDFEVDAICEEILLSSGMVDEAYARYGLRANQGGTYLATFRAVAKKYPHKSAGEILADLVKTTPGSEGKWFAAAKEAGLFTEALALATLAPCDPKTLARAARDFAEKEPEFAIGAGQLSLHWLVKGYGYEVTGLDVWGAYHATLAAADRNGTAVEIKERIRQMIAGGGAAGSFVSQVLARELGLGPSVLPRQLIGNLRPKT